MTVSPSYTLDGRLEWDIASQSLDTDLQTEAIERGILAAVPDLTEENKKTVKEFATILSCTDDLKASWKGGEHKSLSAFVTMFEKWKANQLSYAELWKWRTKTPYRLISIWIDAYLANQSLYEVDPAQLPTEALSAEQKEQLKDKDSFLAVQE